MSDWVLGLLIWFIVALLTSLLIGRFIRGPQGEEQDAPAPPPSGLAGGLQGSGRDNDDLTRPRTRF
jgi:hypothetical protein